MRIEPDGPERWWKSYSLPEPRFTVTCWKCYTDIPQPGEYRGLQTASCSGTLQEIYQAGWRQFYWELCPPGMDPRFWLCPTHALTPPSGSKPCNNPE